MTILTPGFQNNSAKMTVEAAVRVSLAREERQSTVRILQSAL